MDIKLKHRLVGACVILALGVFFLPMILDSEKYRDEIESQIPEQSVLQGQSSTNSNDQGSLVINLEEDEPSKAIVDKAEANANNNKPTQSDGESLEVTTNNEPSSKKEQSEDSVAEAPGKEDVDNKDDVDTADTATQQPTKAEPSEKTTVITADDNESKDSSDNPLEEPSESEQSTFKDTAWVIQIGSFSNEENASGLVSELRNKGFRAYLRKNGKYSRVFVGPYPDKADAEQRTSGLEKIVGNEVKIVEFDPQGH